MMVGVSFSAALSLWGASFNFERHCDCSIDPD